jgi:multiple sugar transport system permease protein
LTFLGFAASYSCLLVTLSLRKSRAAVLLDAGKQSGSVENSGMIPETTTGAAAGTAQAERVSRPRAGRLAQRNTLNGLLFCAPAIVGLVGLTLYPLCMSLYYSFCSYTVLKPAKWVGMANYRLIFRDIQARGQLFESIANSLYYAGLAVPLGVATAFTLALLLNQKVKGLAFFRTLFYVPSVLPVVASSVLWMWLLNAQHGMVNQLLELLGIEKLLSLLGIKTPLGWLADPAWSKPALVLMSLWGVGNATVIFLAGLQNVPSELYEAAELDGASPWQKTRNVTLPMVSPQILFMMVMGLIGAVQYFTQAWVMTNGTGGPANSTMMYPMYLFQNAFQFFKMGYACAMAWLMFVVVVGATALLFKGTSRFVHYGGETR